MSVNKTHLTIRISPQVRKRNWLVTLSELHGVDQQYKSDFLGRNKNSKGNPFSAPVIGWLGENAGSDRLRSANTQKMQ